MFGMALVAASEAEADPEAEPAGRVGLRCRKPSVANTASSQSAHSVRLPFAGRLQPHDLAAERGPWNAVQLLDHDAHLIGAPVRKAMRGDAFGERLRQENMALGHDLPDAIDNEIVGDHTGQVAWPVPAAGRP